MIHKAIYTNYPNVKSIVDNDDGSVTTTDGDGNVVTLDEALITAEVTRLQAVYDSQEYARNRASAYPPIGDQLDMIYHAGLGGDAFQAAISAVKQEYPK